ncbi:hypothetical protein PPO43_02190 [Saprospira sp. CCB-QB6]|uniref:hypothetical protein n=1 Tax=Saprospira sp. CCB-QB6 TaxID=3023936 RepID=UPI0023495D79|nr:hypothetical protein [Saprospira sp. CCB-QB6]WCL81908.1 hypothetical protein PPO43_02190 [Saprospira sp. CCB-QB6]
MTILKNWALLVLLLVSLAACKESAPKVEQQDESEIEQSATEAPQEELTVVAAEAKVSFPTGEYGSLVLGFEGNQLTGYYDMPLGSGNGCSFFLEGQLTEAGKEVAVKAYFPGSEEVVEGTLTQEIQAVTLKLAANPGGQCDPSLYGEGEKLMLSQPATYLRVGVLSQEASVYADAKQAEAKGKLDKFAVVFVLQQMDGWLEVQEMNGEIKGWISAKELFGLR